MKNMIYFEDLSVGQKIEIGPISVTEKEIIEFAKKYGLNSIRECAVFPKPDKAPHRILIEFSRSENKQMIKESLVIEKAGRHNYSEDYKKLTREFYTIFE